MNESKDCRCDAGLEPQAEGPDSPVGTINAPGRARVRYRTGIHPTFKQSMLEHMATTPGLAAHSSRDDDGGGVALIDTAAVLLDILTFYQEVAINEGYLRTASERLSVLELARSIGYELNPGVAASTRLAFEVQTSPGMDEWVEIPVGVQVQSIPKPDELPQTFETIESIEAHPAWSSLPIDQTQPQTWVEGKDNITVSGISLGLAVGGILVVQYSDASWLAVQIAELDQDYDRQATVIGLTQPLEAPPSIGSGYPKVVAFSARATAFGSAAPDWRTLPAASKREVLGLAEADPIPDEYKAQWPDFVIHLPGRFASRYANLGSLLMTEVAVAKMAPMEEFDAVWEFDSVIGLPYTGGLRTDTVSLDAEYRGLLVGSLIYLEDPAGTALLEVEGVETVSRSDFALSGKSTVITTDSSDLYPFREAVRTLSAHVGSTELTIVEELDTSSVSGSQLELPTQIPSRPGSTELIDVPEFSPGRVLAVSGVDAGSGDAISEQVEVEAVSLDADGTRWLVDLASPGLANTYERESFVVYGNVASATHGSSHAQVLGHGDARQRFMTMVPAQAPITHVSSSAPSGADSTLEVSVDEVRWTQVDSFYAQASDAEVYIVRRDDSGASTIVFGDGKTGARLPTGVNNVRAEYRAGLGAGGNLDPGRLTSLITRPLGLTNVSHPLAASGGQDAEGLEDARTSAPLGVTTLERLVSVQDYEDFGRTFAGIAKAQSSWAWFGEVQGILLTVAGTDGAAVTSDMDVHANLLDAIALWRDAAAPVQLVSYEPRSFKLAATLYVDASYEQSEIEAEASEALESAYAFDSMRLGQSVSTSEIIALLQGIEGVVGVDLDRLHFADADPERRRLPARVGRVTRAGLVKPAQLLTLEAEGAELWTVTADC